MHSRRYEYLPTYGFRCEPCGGFTLVRPMAQAAGRRPAGAARCACSACLLPRRSTPRAHGSGARSAAAPGAAVPGRSPRPPAPRPILAMPDCPPMIGAPTDRRPGPLMRDQAVPGQTGGIRTSRPPGRAIDPWSATGRQPIGNKTPPTTSATWICEGSGFGSDLRRGRRTGLLSTSSTSAGATGVGEAPAG